MKNVHRLSLMVVTVLTAVFLVVDLPLMAQMGGQQRRGQQGAPKGAGTAQIDKSSPKLTPQQQQRVQQLQKQQQTLQQNLQRVQGECRRVQADVQENEWYQTNRDPRSYNRAGSNLATVGDDAQINSGASATEASSVQANLCEQLKKSVTERWGSFVSSRTVVAHNMKNSRPAPKGLTSAGNPTSLEAAAGRGSGDHANVDMQNVITKFEEIKVTVTGLANQEQQISGQLQNIGNELEALGVTSFLKNDKFTKGIAE